MSFVILALIWIAFCALHSFLISITVTRFIKERLRGASRWYRLFYNFFSSVTLVPVLLYTWSIKDDYFFMWEGGLEYISYAMIALATLLILLSLREYDILQFAGIRQIMQDGPRPGLGNEGNVKETGILGMMRHPVYTAVFLLLWSGDLNYTMLIVNIILSFYLVIGAFLEERKLVAEFGEAYLEYKKRVPMFVPGMPPHPRRGQR